MATADSYYYSEPKIEVRAYLYTVFMRIWIVIAVIAVIMTADIVYTFTQQPIYKATSLVLIEKAKSSEQPKEAVAPEMSDIQYYNTQYEIIKSRPLCEKVASKLDLASMVDFQNAKLSPAELLQKMIDVEPVKNTRLVRVSVRYKEPELSAKMVNELCKLYVEQNSENMLFMSKEILKAFQNGAAVEIGPDTVAVTGESKVPSKDSMALSLPSIMNNKTIQDLNAQRIEAEAELASLRGRYKDNHPMIVELSNKLKYTNDQITTETNKIVGSLKANLAGLLQANNIRVVDYARVPKEPFTPDRIKNIMMGLAASLFVSIGLVFLLEFMDNSVRNEEDVTKDLGLSCLGCFPFISRANFQELEKINQKKELSDAIRSIRTNIAFSMPKGAPKTILVTSTLPGEGKSSITAYLGYSFSKTGAKTLILDGDMYKSSHQDIFRVKDKTPGLSDILSKDVPVDSIIRKTSYANLYISTSGSKTNKFLELVSSDKMKNILEELSKQFDRIIIDTPPCYKMSDALVLSRLCEMNVIVIKSGVVDKMTLKEMNGKFAAVGSKINGAIINYLDNSQNTYYHHKYSAYCKHYYTDAENKDDKAEDNKKDPPK